MKDANYLSGCGCHSVGVNVYASVANQTSKAVQPVIRHTIFISACLQMCLRYLPNTIFSFASKHLFAFTEVPDGWAYYPVKTAH